MFPTRCRKPVLPITLALALLGQAMAARASSADGAGPPPPAATSAAAPVAVGAAPKPAVPGSTSGPAAVLTAQQRALLAAKWSATVQGRPAVAAPEKHAPVMTIPDFDPSRRSSKLAVAPGMRPIFRPATGTVPSPGRPSPSVGVDPAADAIRAEFGPAAARSIGLGKSGDRIWRGGTSTAGQEVRP